MTRDISDILAECLDAIETQQATVGSCLAKYPEQREELAALLAVRTVLQDVARAEEVSPSAEFRATARASLLTKLEPRHAPQTSRRTQSSRSRSTSWLNIFRSGFGRIAFITSLVLILLSSITGGTIYASSRALPGGNLYNVKTGVEQYRLSRVETDDEFIALQLMFAERRIGELEELVARGEGKLLESTSKAYASTLHTIAERVDGIDLPAAREVLTSRLQETVDFHQPRLTEMDAALDILMERGQISAENTAIATANGAVESAHTFVHTSLLVAPTDERASIFETIHEIERYAAFVALLIESDLESLLTDNEFFTLFVPLDGYDAFTSMEDDKLRRQRVLYHIGRGQFSAEDLMGSDTLLMALGNEMVIDVVGGELVLNGSVRVVSSNVIATNGIIHFIDLPLTPPNYFP